MADHGRPGGAPSEPWHSQQPTMPYGPPPDPWQPGYVPPGEQYAPPPGQRRTGWMVLFASLAGVAVLAVGIGIGFFLLAPASNAPKNTPTEAAANPTVSSAPTGSSAPVAVPPAPEPSTDPRFVKVGQCVRNDGTQGGQPKLTVTPCGPKTYQVLRRFDGATSGEKDAEAKCAKVPGYTNWYFFNSPLDTLDFVLCLKSR